MLGLARFHAEKAGVAADIHFQQRTFAELSSKRPYGCVICNPPYGERLGRAAEALALHRAMPDVFRRLKTWSFFILTALPDFEAVIGQSATRRRKLYNGRIECTYYQFLGPKPGEKGGEREKGRKGRRGDGGRENFPLLPCSPAPLLPPSSAVSRPRRWNRPRSSGRD